MKTISISGNIGCGKSTVLNYCKTAFPGVSIVQEPVEEWQPYLNSFYLDAKTHSLPLQIKIREFYDRTFNKQTDNMIIERNSFESLNVFAKVLNNHGQLSDAELSLLSQQSVHKPDYVIYLKASPETCLHRLLQRNRENETNISTSYLREIGHEYDRLYLNSPVKSIFVVDAEESDTAVLMRVCHILEQIIN
jgi:deoxyadenosine/deoxycytidine kinase